jgi:hypothetical protein
VEGAGLLKLVSLAIRGWCHLLKVIDWVGVRMRWLRFDRGNFGEKIVTGMGEVMLMG